MEKESFLGTGWAFPPTFNTVKATNQMVADEYDIVQSLTILLSTKLKERVMRSDYGCDLSPLLYESITVTLLTKIRGIIENAILMYEPRIDLIEVDFTMDDTNNGVVNIDIIYKVRATNSRKNHVFPFYLEEGTFVTK
jgi:uncharacterized protein